jgi:hypothetical protein
MRAETALAVVLTVALVATLPAVALAGADAANAVASGQANAVASGQAAAAVTTPAAEDRTVHLDVKLLDAGDANWTVSTYVPLDDEDDRAAFRELGRRYVNGTARVGMDADTFRRVASSASAAADRPMRIENCHRGWTIRDDTGVLVLRFTWRNFARDEGDRLVADDAFRTNSGTWLPELEPGQVLVIRPPDGVGFLETPRGKGVTNGTLRWEGPQSFGADYFRIVYRTGPDETPVTPTNNRTTTPPTGDPPTDTPGHLLPAGTFLLVSVLAVGAAAYLWRRRRGPDDRGTGDAGGGRVSAGAAGAAAAGGSAAVDETDEPAVDEAEEPAEPTPEDPFAGVDVEMLSDEERVLRLLEANGGRMKQARIVKETDWSNAKVSQLLSSMDEEEAINKLRIGRENLISLPDVDLDSVDE